MRIGVVILPEHRWWVAEPKWRAAEEFGFHHVWTYDHIGWRSLVEGPWFGAVPTLTAAAMITSRIRLGMMVTSPNFRHPVPFARELLALDDISDGRFTLGIGAGGLGYDTQVLGEAPISGAQRFTRFTEFTESLGRLLSEKQSSYSGEYFTAVDAYGAPGCVQQPRMPFVLAANGPKSLRFAARQGEGWVTTGGHAEDVEQWWRLVRDTVARFEEALAEQGRDPRSVPRYLQTDACPVTAFESVDFFAEQLGRAKEAGFTDMLAPWPRDEGVYAARESVLEQVAADVLPTVES
ncbi:LLM class flavin-dependent oxidoreductase [Sciscionella sediminilitoris]|uniref:LLM class flavin-dependent oxidoreductase n=1 Tax=Sciscionella sediminilitoris TaxID=1445613 RepID=UPI00068DCC9E|nr:LLM class flavin-dependent oxidoreductase [Sciscionella sp. SE31]